MPKALDLSGQKFGRLIAIKRSEQKNSRGAMWECQCECGNIHHALAYDLKRNKIKSCGCLRQDNGQQKVKNDILGQTFGLLTVIERVPIADGSKTTKWLCQCECGNTHLAERTHLIDGHINSCGCLRRKSLGERKIADLLNKFNIPYEQEKTFPTCRSPITNHLLRFDFYVDNNYLIEYDGSQHFNQGMGQYDNKQKFTKTQIHDQYKDQWCQDNNITLIRIPYTKYEHLTIDDLIPSENK